MVRLQGLSPYATAVNIIVQMPIIPAQFFNGL